MLSMYWVVMRLNGLLRIQDKSWTAIFVSSSNMKHSNLFKQVITLARQTVFNYNFERVAYYRAAGQNLIYSVLSFDKSSILTFQKMVLISSSILSIGIFIRIPQLFCNACLCKIKSPNRNQHLIANKISRHCGKHQLYQLYPLSDHSCE